MAQKLHFISFIVYFPLNQLSTTIKKEKEKKYTKIKIFYTVSVYAYVLLRFFS